MSTLENVTYDDIFNKIMLILVANEGKLYDQYKLYSLVIDKITKNEVICVPPDFKYKFFITLRQLMLKDDNIKVMKENNIYQVIYNAPKDIKLDNINYNPEWIDKSALNNFIINNTTEVDINYKDPESGNTIYHEVLSEHNSENVKKLIDTLPLSSKENTFYNIKNNYNKTPIECIKDVQVSIIIINDLNKRINEFDNKFKILENRLKILENKNEIADCSIINFINIKFYHFLKNNWANISFIFISIILYFMIKLVI